MLLRFRVQRDDSMVVSNPRRVLSLALTGLAVNRDDKGRRGGGLNGSGGERTQRNATR